MTAHTSAQEQAFLDDLDKKLWNAADRLRSNLPFNVSEWWDGRLEVAPRWAYGTPPKSNANYAREQHMLHHLAPDGSMALLLANGSMTSNTKGEGEIRRAPSKPTPSSACSPSPASFSPTPKSPPASGLSRKRNLTTTNAASVTAANKFSSSIPAN